MIFVFPPKCALNQDSYPLFPPVELIRKKPAYPISGKYINLTANLFLIFLENLCNLFIKTKVNYHHCYEKHGVNDHQK